MRMHMKRFSSASSAAPEVMRARRRCPIRSPAPAEVVVRVRAAGVNPVDAYIRTGTYARKPPLPYTPGSRRRGRSRGGRRRRQGLQARRSRLHRGDDNTVAGAGTYAELRALRRRRSCTVCPTRVSFAQGAALGVPYAHGVSRAVSARAARRPGETVLVHGATGGVGIAAVELAHAHGMTVIGTGGTDAGLAGRARARRRRRRQSPRAELHSTQIMKATGGRGVDVIVEMAAHVNLDKRSRRCSPSTAASSSSATADASRSTRAQAMGRDAAILGMTLFNVDRRRASSRSTPRSSPGWRTAR